MFSKSLGKCSFTKHDEITEEDDVSEAGIAFESSISAQSESVPTKHDIASVASPDSATQSEL